MADPFTIIAGIIAAAGPVPTPREVMGELEAVASDNARPKGARSRKSSRSEAARPFGPSDPPPKEGAPFWQPSPSAPSEPAAVFHDFSDDPSQSGGSVDDGVAEPDDQREDPDDLNRRLAWFPLTDLGNVERFRERHRSRLIWCDAIGWLWWDGQRWSKEGADQCATRAEHDTVRAIQDEAKAIEGEAGGASGDRQETLLALAKKLKSHGRASERSSAMALRKRAASYLKVETGKLDADPFKINVRNGTLVVRREWTKQDGDFKRWPSYGDYIRLKPHDPDDLITKIADVSFDSKAERPQFESFISEVQPDQAMRRFLQQWKGYGLTADATEHRMALFIGKGRNGKSVFEDATANVAGDYAETVPIETFLATGREANANAPSPARALLHNARMVRTSEPNQGVKLDEGFIKLVTGGDPIQARNLNLPLFRFYPVLKLTVSGNHRPKISGTDEGIWSRVTVVPWEVFIPPEKRDRRLTEKLKAESSGILNWMLDGLSEWIEHGLILPEMVKAATAEYRRDSDQLGRFIEMCTQADPEARVQSSVFLAVFNAWARVNGGSEWSGRGLANAMTERGYKKDKSSVMFWLGLKLTKSEADFADGNGRVGGASGGNTAGVVGREGDEIAF